MTEPHRVAAIVVLHFGVGLRIAKATVVQLSGPTGGHSGFRLGYEVWGVSGKKMRERTETRDAVSNSNVGDGSD